MKLRAFFPRVTLVICALTVFPALVNAVEVSGDITTATWTAANSPYRVTDTINIPVGDTLTIDAGVDVLFDADVSFNVNGALYAIGTSSDSIRFVRGTASEWGGIRLDGSQCRFEFVRISDGKADNGGGVGVYSNARHIHIFRNCVFSGNTADGFETFDPFCIYSGCGGGVFLHDGGYAEFTNCVFAENRAYGHLGGGPIVGTMGAAGSAIFGCWYTNVKLINCTITGNTGVQGRGAIYVAAGATFTATNSIMWGNDPSDPTSLYSLVGTYYSDIEGGIKNYIIDGGGNINEDPLFVDAANGDYRLSAGSPCIDTGDPESPLDPDGTRVDMGAFPYDGTVGVTTPTPVPFALAQNAPNPFNPVTSLRFSIPEAGAVRLAIYDVNGRLVRTLVDEYRAAGMHEVTWDARDDAGRAVASGVYVYRLTAGADVAVRRMVLVR